MYNNYMKKRTKILLISFSSVLAIVIILLLIVVSYGFIFNIKPKLTSYGYEFSSENKPIFDIDTYTKTIEIEEDEDILVLTNIHLYGIFDNKSIKLIKNIVNDTKPKLIILVGDQCYTPFNYKAYKDLIKLFDSFKTPWALVFGNHDNFGRANKKVLTDLLMESEYSLYDYGFNNITYPGAGNYVINIKRNEELVHSFIMLDCHQSDTALSGNPEVKEIQVEWYKWVIEGLLTFKEDLTTSVVCHVPIPEFVEAYDYGEIISGEKREDSCIPSINTHLFDAITEYNSTKYIFSGHDHVNDFHALYEGVNFLYCLKSGYGSYYDKDLIGCMTLNAFDNYLDIKYLLY